MGIFGKSLAGFFDAITDSKSSGSSRRSLGSILFRVLKSYILTITTTMINVGFGQETGYFRYS